MPRLTTVDSLSFQDVWGYCAVIGPRDLLWSGHRLPDPAGLPGLDDYVASLSRGLSLASPLSTKVFTDGAVCWLANELVEGTWRQVNGVADGGEEQDDAMIAAALARIARQRYFIVLLERNRARQPLRAVVEAVDVASPEDARDYILRHPRILALEAEGIRHLHKAGPLAAGSADSAFTCERLHGPLN